MRGVIQDDSDDYGLLQVRLNIRNFIVSSFSQLTMGGSFYPPQKDNLGFFLAFFVLSVFFGFKIILFKI